MEKFYTAPATRSGLSRDLARNTRFAGANLAHESAMTIVKPTLEVKLENMYGSRASLVRETHLQERINGQVLWTHDVLVYELPDHPEARFCYAWLNDGRVVTVLGVPPIRSAMDAVQSHLRGRNTHIARRRAFAFAPRRGRAGLHHSAPPPEKGVFA